MAHPYDELSHDCWSFRLQILERLKIIRDTVADEELVGAVDDARYLFINGSAF
jgi:hypothetical protein